MLDRSVYPANILTSSGKMQFYNGLTDTLRAWCCVGLVRTSEHQNIRTSEHQNIRTSEQNRQNIIAPSWSKKCLNLESGILWNLVAPCLKDCASNHVKEKKKKIDFPYFPKERSTEEEQICGFRLSAERVSVMTPLALGCGCSYILK